ncbi:hypothetical protein Tco_0630421, partial [Tanacetum coccineum]
MYKLNKALLGFETTHRTWYDLYGEVSSPLRNSLKGTWKSTLSSKTRQRYSPESCDPVDTPIVEKSKLDKDTQGKVVDPTHYHGMVGTLMYLTASRPDLTFATLIMRVSKILDEVLLDVCNYWETDLLVGHQKGRKALRYPVEFNELTAMASKHNSSRPALHEMTPAIISLGLVPNPPLSTPFVPPSRTDWDILFQPLFDELLNPSSSVDWPAPEVITPIAEVVALEPAALTGSYISISGEYVQIGKETGLDLLHLSRGQILWGMYHQKYVDYVYLLWEDLVYQIENKMSKKNKDMYYLRFTKVIINHFMAKDQSISRRNKVDWHMASNDPILTTMKFIPQHEVVQNYGAILPDTLTNQVIKEEKTEQDLIASLGKRLKATAKVAKSGKKKQPTQRLETLSEIALPEAEQINI